MNILVNCSNLKSGGGLQVADSVCGQLHRFSQHRFVVVLSPNLDATAQRIKDDDNVAVVIYEIPNTFHSIVLGRDKLLDGLVAKNEVDAVLTIFGPSRWKPRCKHLCGFARAQLLLKNPLQKELPFKERLLYRIWTWGFKKSSDTFYTENRFISDMLPRLLGNVRVYTVTNYYNQVFDNPDNWSRSFKLPEFNGTTMLTVSTTASHKNLKIMIPVAEYLERKYSGFQFRFVLTCDEAAMPVPNSIRCHFVYVDKVHVSECPILYEQADIMFMPTLLECFTATYPEAMRMGVPIVTTDLEFAHGLCGEAACYYSAIDAIAAAEAIYKVATDKEYAARLAANGKEQLKKFDSYEQRADKLISILEEMTQSNN